MTSGAIAGPIVELDLRTLYLKDLEMHGATVMPLGIFENLVGYIEKGDIRPLLAGQFSIYDIKKAQEMGLIFQSVPLEELDETVKQLTNRIKGVPKNQLMMMKMMVNQAYENMGLSSTQTLATLFDGIARHSPEGIWFKQRAEKAGFKQAVAERDSGDPIPGSKK